MPKSYETGRFRPRHPRDPDDCGPGNDLRAEWADTALEAFKRECELTPGALSDDEALSDLLANLMHWSERNGYDFDHFLETARMNFEAEGGTTGPRKRATVA